MANQFQIKVKDGSGGLLRSLVLDTRAQFNSRIKELSNEYGTPKKHSDLNAEFRA